MPISGNMPETIIPATEGIQVTGATLDFVEGTKFDQTGAVVKYSATGDFATGTDVTGNTKWYFGKSGATDLTGLTEITTATAMAMSHVGQTLYAVYVTTGGSPKTFIQSCGALSVSAATTFGAKAQVKLNGGGAEQNTTNITSLSFVPAGKALSDSGTVVGTFNGDSLGLGNWTATLQIAAYDIWVNGLKTASTIKKETSPVTANMVTLHAKPKDANGKVTLGGVVGADAAAVQLIVPMNMPITIAAGNSTAGDTHDYKFTGWQLDSSYASATGTFADATAASTTFTPTSAKETGIIAEFAPKMYKVTGILSGTTGSLTSVTFTGNAITGPGNITPGTYTTGTNDGCSISGGAISMLLPKGTYTISSVAATGFAVTSTKVEVTETAEISITGAANSAFTITTDKENFNLQFFIAPDNGTTAVTEKTDTAVYGYGEQTIYTINVKNTGNLPLYNVVLNTAITGAQFTATTTAFGTAISVWNVGEVKSFTVQAQKNLGYSATPYAAAFTFTAHTKQDSGDVGKTYAYTQKLQVDKQPITTAGVKDIAQPVTGAAVSSVTISTAANGVGVVNDANISANNFELSTTINWGGDTTFAGGKIYTATVTLTPNANYKFAPATGSGAGTYTFNGKTITNGNIDGAGALTLSYQFPGTAPTLADTAFTATGRNTGTIKTNVTAVNTGETQVYYMLVKNGTTVSIDAATIIAQTPVTGVYFQKTAFAVGGSAYDILASGGLSSSTDYTLHATARTELGGKYGTPAAPVSGAGKTWNNVSVAVQMGSASATSTGKVSLPTGATPGVNLESNTQATPSKSATIAVQDGVGVALNAVRTGSNDGWAFKEWMISPTASGVGTGTPAPNKETANIILTMPTAGSANAAGSVTTATAYFRKTIEGTPTLSGSASVGATLTATPNSCKIGGETPAFSPATTGVTFRWQYSDVGAQTNWTNIVTNGDGYTYAVVDKDATNAANNFYVGRYLRVAVSYQDADGAATTVYSAGQKVGTAVANPTAITLVQNQYGGSALSPDNEKGGLMLTFAASKDDDKTNVANQNIGQYTVKVTGTKTSSTTVTFNARANSSGAGYNVIYNAGTGTYGGYTVYFYADPNNIVPTDAANGGYTYKAEVTAKKATGKDDYSDAATAAPSAETTVSAGKVRLTAADLTYNGGTPFTAQDGAAYTYDFGKPAFNGTKQTVKTIGTPQTGFNTSVVTNYCATEVQTGTTTTDGAADRNLTAGASNKYYISASVTGSYYYLDLARANGCLGTWEIGTATTTLGTADKTNAAQNVTTNLKGQAEVTYSAAAVSPNPANPITSGYTLSFAITTYPAGATSSNTALNSDGTGFRAAIAGEYVITVSATALGTDQYKANLGVPVANTFKVTVGANRVTGIELFPNYTQDQFKTELGKTHIAGTVTQVQEYSGKTSTVFNLQAMAVRVTYTSGAKDIYTLGGVNGIPKLPAALFTLFDSSAPASIAGSPNQDGATFTYTKAGTAKLQVASSLSMGPSVTSNAVILALQPAVLNYAVTGVNKEYDGIVNANGYTAGKNSGKNATVVFVTTGSATVSGTVGNTTTGYQLDGATADAVSILNWDGSTNGGTKLVFADKNVATGKTVSVSGTPVVIGAQKNFYTLGTETTGSADISKATLKITDLANTRSPVNHAVASIPLNSLNLDNAGAGYEGFAVQDAAKTLGGYTYDSGFGVQGEDKVAIAFKANYVASTPGSSDPTDGKPVKVNVSVGAVTLKNAIDQQNYTLDYTALTAKGTADGGSTRYQRNLGEITARTVRNVVLASGSAVRTATYGTQAGTYPLQPGKGFYDVTDATVAKQMSLYGLTLTVTWSTGAQDSYVLGKDTLPAGVTFTTENAGTTLPSALTAGNAAIDDTRTNFVLGFSAATLSTKITASYLGQTSGVQEFKLAPKALRYTITAANKTYDGTTKAQGVESVPGTINAAAQNSTIAITDWATAKVGDDDANVTATLTFASKDQGSRAVAATGVTLNGGTANDGDEKFYSIADNSGSPANATIGKATIQVNGLTGDSVIAPILQYTATLTATGTATNTAVAGSVATPQFTTVAKHGVLGGDSIMLDFDVTYTGSQTAGDKNQPHQVTNSTAKPHGTSGVYANYTFDFTALTATATTALNNGTVTARSITAFEIVKKPNDNASPVKYWDNYTYPDTALKLENMVVKLTFNSGSESYTYASDAYDALGLTYALNAKGGTVTALGSELPVGTTAIAVVLPDAAGGKSATYAITVSQYMVLPGDVTLPSGLYAEKVYDGTKDVLSAGIWTAADKATRITIKAPADVANLTGKTHTSFTGNANDIVYVGESGKVNYALIPIKANIFGSGKETAAWYKVTLTYDNRNVSGEELGNKLLNMAAVTGAGKVEIVGDHAGNYTAAAGTGIGATANVSTISKITRKELVVTGLHVKPVYFAATGDDMTVTNAATYEAGTATVNRYDATGLVNDPDASGTPQDKVTLGYSVTYDSSDPGRTKIPNNAAFPYSYKTDNTTPDTFTLKADGGYTNGLMISGGAQGNNYKLKAAAPTMVKGALNINDLKQAVIMPQSDGAALTPLKMQIPLGIKLMDGAAPYNNFAPDAAAQMTTAATGQYLPVNTGFEWISNVGQTYVGHDSVTADSGWYKSRDQKAVFGFDSFYRMKLTVEDQVGYRFTSNTQVVLKDGANMSGAKTYQLGKPGAGSVTLNNGTAETSISINYRFPNATNGTEKIKSATIYLGQPQAGDTVKNYRKYDYRNDKEYTITSGTVKWYDGNLVDITGANWKTGTPLADNYSFVGGENQYYTVEYEVYAHEGYDFVPGWTDFYFVTNPGFVKLNLTQMKVTAPGLSNDQTTTVAKYLVRCVLQPVDASADQVIDLGPDGKLEHINVNLPAPTTGSRPYSGAAIPRNENNIRYNVKDLVGTDVEWYKYTSTEDPSTHPGTKVTDLTKPFEAEQSYYAKFKLEVKDGTNHGLKMAGAIVNTIFAGNSVATVTGMDTTSLPVTLRGTEVADGYTRYITATVTSLTDITVIIEFKKTEKIVESAKAVQNVTAVVVPPAAGAAPAAPTLSAGSAKSVVVNTHLWTPAENPYVSGGTYAITIDVKPIADGKSYMDGTTDFYIDPHTVDVLLPHVPEGTTLTLRGVTPVSPGGTSDNTYRMLYTFDPIAKKTISEVDIAVDEAQTGGIPDLEGSITSIRPDASAITPITGLTWAPDAVMGHTFESGEKYTVTAVLTPETGYQFSKTNTSYLVNGKKAICTGVDADGKATITYQFKITGIPAGELASIPVGVGTPIKDNAIGVAVEIPNPNANFTVTDTKWNDAAPTGKFVAGKVYTVKVTVEVVPSAKVTANTIFQINGLTGKLNGGDVKVTKIDATHYTLEHSFPAIPTGGGGGGGGSITPPPAKPGAALPVVIYWIGDKGTTTDLTAESVKEGEKPVNVPKVKGINGFTFKGWSLSDPAKTKDPKLVEPKEQTIDGDTTFYAVYGVGKHKVADHTSYLKGYEDGNFGPADNITRGSVATIIARACLEGFVEGKDYGDGGYSDIKTDWAKSAIVYCTQKNVFKGYEDGTFKPTQPITREEFATVIARLAGVKKSTGLTFTDQDKVGSWAVDGVFTTVANGWVNGYTDGSFKPQNNIQRDEAVKIVNGYLVRGVDAAGLKDMKAGSYKTWPDVPADQWAYYHIVEASNNHSYYFADDKLPPEVWVDAAAKTGK